MPWNSLQFVQQLDQCGFLFGRADVFRGV